MTVDGRRFYMRLAIRTREGDLGPARDARTALSVAVDLHVSRLLRRRRSWRRTRMRGRKARLFARVNIKCVVVECLSQRGAPDATG